MEYYRHNLISRGSIHKIAGNIKGLRFSRITVEAPTPSHVMDIHLESYRTSACWATICNWAWMGT